MGTRHSGAFSGRSLSEECGESLISSSSPFKEQDNYIRSFWGCQPIGENFLLKRIAVCRSQVKQDPAVKRPTGPLDFLYPQSLLV
jgi:hypothetical protein